jgi:hypothetical protein
VSNGVVLRKLNSGIQPWIQTKPPQPTVSMATPIGTRSASSASRITKLATPPAASDITAPAQCSPAAGGPIGRFKLISARLRSTL